MLQPSNCHCKVSVFVMAGTTPLVRNHFNLNKAKCLWFPIQMAYTLVFYKNIPHMTFSNIVFGAAK